jgi:hypothetical protein
MSLAALFVVGCASLASAQFNDVVIDPALGSRPIFGPGGFISNGNGYRAYGPAGFGGYYTGRYYPGNDLGNGPSPYYSPIYSALAAAPSPNAPTGRAGWAFRPSLPFTGKRNYRLFRR